MLKWRVILEEFSALDQITVPRHNCKHQRPKKVQLRGFSDVSKDACAAVIYVHSIYADGNIETRLIASKTRISPEIDTLLRVTRDLASCQID